MPANEANPHPFVYWAQNRSQILLRVDLKDVQVCVWGCLFYRHF